MKKLIVTAFVALATMSGHVFAWQPCVGEDCGFGCEIVSYGVGGCTCETVGSVCHDCCKIPVTCDCLLGPGTGVIAGTHDVSPGHCVTVAWSSYCVGESGG